MSLKSIDLFGCNNISDTALVSIASSCPNLEVFSSSSAFLIGDLGVSSLLQGCPKLQRLDVSYCWRISDACFSMVCSGTTQEAGRNLVYIDLQFCYQINNRCLEHLKRLPNLRLLCVSQCQSVDRLSKEALRAKNIIVVDEEIPSVEWF